MLLIHSHTVLMLDQRLFCTWGVCGSVCHVCERGTQGGLKLARQRQAPAPLQRPLLSAPKSVALQVEGHVPYSVAAGVSKSKDHPNHLVRLPTQVPVWLMNHDPRKKHSEHCMSPCRHSQQSPASRRAREHKQASRQQGRRATGEPLWT